MVVISKFKGGIGNQLFIYALGRRIADSLGSKLILDNLYYSQTNHYHPFCVHGFNIRYHIPGEDEDIMVTNIYKEKTMDYDPDVLDIKDGCILSGYWQNYLYVEPIRDMLRKELVPLTALEGYSLEAEQHIKTNNKIPVCVHFRGGDFKHWGKFNVVTRDYYKQSFEVIRQKYGDNITLYVFSDDMDQARATLGDIIPRVEIKVPNFNPVIDLYLMSLCQAFIIPNSTFSWWGSFLSKAENKLIIAPDRWWSEAPDLTDMEKTRDLITSEMTLIKV